MKLNERTVKLGETFCNILESWKDFNWMKKKCKNSMFILLNLLEKYMKL